MWNGPVEQWVKCVMRKFDVSRRWCVHGRTQFIDNINERVVRQLLGLVVLYLRLWVKCGTAECGMRNENCETMVIGPQVRPRDRRYYAVYRMLRVAGAVGNCVMRTWKVAFNACCRNLNLPFYCKVCLTEKCWEMILIKVTTVFDVVVDTYKAYNTSC